MKSKITTHLELVNRMTHHSLRIRYKISSNRLYLTRFSNRCSYSNSSYWFNSNSSNNNYWYNNSNSNNNYSFNSSSSSRLSSSSCYNNRTANKYLNRIKIGIAIIYKTHKILEYSNKRNSQSVNKLCSLLRSKTPIKTIKSLNNKSSN